MSIEWNETGIRSLGASGDVPVDQNSNLDPAVLGSTGRSFISRCWSVFTPRARRHHTVDRHTSHLYQVSDYGFGTIFAQLFIHLGFATCVGITHHLYEVSSM